MKLLKKLTTILSLISLLAITTAWVSGNMSRPPVLVTNTPIFGEATGKLVVGTTNGLFAIVGANPIKEIPVPTPPAPVNNTFRTVMTNELYFRTNALQSGYFIIWSNFQYNGYPAPRGTYNWIWNTNSLLFRNGVMDRGATAISCGQSLGAQPTQIKFTLLTKRIAVTSGHYFYQPPGTNNEDIIEVRNQPIYFLNTNNVLVTQWCNKIYVWWDKANTNDQAGRDRAFAWFTNDVPDSVQPMRILTYGTNYGFWAYYNKDASFSPVLFANQFGEIVSSVLPSIGLRYANAIPGDSGSTSFIITTNNEVVYVSTISSDSYYDVMINRIKLITQAEGLDTNTYAPQTFSIDSYP